LNEKDYKEINDFREFSDKEKFHSCKYPKKVAAIFATFIVWQTKI